MPRTFILTEEQVALAANSLRVAAEVYRADAGKVGIASPSLADHFTHQAEQAEAMAVQMECAD